jgi:hypothetical protein
MGTLAFGHRVWLSRLHKGTDLLFSWPGNDLLLRVIPSEIDLHDGKLDTKNLKDDISFDFHWCDSCLKSIWCSISWARLRSDPKSIAPNRDRRPGSWAFAPNAEARMEYSEYKLLARSNDREIIELRMEYFECELLTRSNDREIIELRMARLDWVKPCWFVYWLLSYHCDPERSHLLWSFTQTLRRGHRRCDASMVAIITMASSCMRG